MLPIKEEPIEEKMAEVEDHGTKSQSRADYSLELEFEPEHDVALRWKRNQHVLASLKFTPENGGKWRDVGTSQKIQDALTDLWLQQKSCDDVLAMSDGHMQVHKTVLAAHSLGLAKDFLRFSPSKQLKINVEDLEPAVVCDMMEYLYLGEVSINMENVVALYKCANEFGLFALFNQTRAFLSNCDNINAITLLNLCEKAGVRDIHLSIMQYICDNFHETTPSDDFTDVSLSSLVDLLSRDELNVRSEMVIFNAITRWVDHDRQKRLTHALHLLKCVRFRLLDPELLVRGVERIDWIFEDFDCKALLGNAYK
jgi:hypothetical protein